VPCPQLEASIQIKKQIYSGQLSNRTSRQIEQVLKVRGYCGDGRAATPIKLQLTLVNPKPQLALVNPKPQLTLVNPKPS
jgi:hypothetical protein